MNYALFLNRFLGMKLPAFAIFRKDFDLIKTLYYNLRYGNFSRPFRIYPKVHIHISPTAKIIHKGGLLQLGLRWNVERFRLSEFILRDNAILEINDDFDIHTGCNIVVDPGAKLSLGKGGLNNNVRIIAFNSITLGHNVYVSDNAIIRDSDNHPIAGNSNAVSAPITIGDNVLIGINATILKGVTIGDGAVVAANSLVNRPVPAKALVGGVPARVLKENIEWGF